MLPKGIGFEVQCLICIYKIAILLFKFLNILIKPSEPKTQYFLIHSSKVALLTFAPVYEPDMPNHPSK